MTPVLEIDNLRVSIGGRDVLTGVDLALRGGEVTALIGRSGSGKSMTALAMMGLLPTAASVSGAIRYSGENLLELDDARMRRRRGRDIAMIFQEPMTALNPLQTIGAQVAEMFRIHQGLSARDAMDKALPALADAGLDPDRISPSRYPHMLSGGQRQRAMIAMATALAPRVLIADEPTTALDATTQAEILALLRNIAAKTGASLLLITHDLAAVSRVADRVAVLDSGRIAADLPADAFYAHADTPLARAFLPARLKRTAPAARDGVILEAKAISCDYSVAPRTMFDRVTTFRAVDNVSFQIRRGENLAIIGESGSGKSTLARALLGLHQIASGEIQIDGERFPAPDRATNRRLRRKVQIVFQDPFSSFNPRMRVREIIAEPLHLCDVRPDRSATDALVSRLLTDVGLNAADRRKFPHEFSGGQRQRIALARALATNPEIIVLDEATSALDIESRNRVLALLQNLSEASGVAFVFITHDLSVVRDFADRIVVLKDGRAVESSPADGLFEAPQHEYTRRLAAAAPVIRWRSETPTDGT